MKKSVMKTRVFLAGTLLAAFIGSSPVQAAPAEESAEKRVYSTGRIGWGPQLGLTVNPDQFHMGLHMHVGTQGIGFHLRPNFDVGFGDGVTVVAVNLDVVRRFAPGHDNWAPFLGGGFGANFSEFDTRRPTPGNPQGLGSNFESGLGFTVVFGLETNLGGEAISVQARIGIVDAPECKLTAGWTIFR